jgi:hypothetical protein
MYLCACPRSSFLWKRPPHEHFSRCADFDTNVHRISELTAALNSTASDPGYKEYLEVIKQAGGNALAWKELRDTQLQQPDLKKHVDWAKEQRAYLTFRHINLTRSQALWQLDYGGFTDSGGKKVSVWSATVMTKQREDEHIDFFFDAANQTSARPGAKKNGDTGIFFLSEVLDTSRSPDGSGVSLARRLFPEVTHHILSGDTGNGYRAYEMLEELSALFERYQTSVELIPLPPGHAWNKTDARIAYQNKFLAAFKAVSRLFGAEQFAAAFRAASDAKVTKRRKFMARSSVFFRVVKRTDAVERAEKKKVTGAMLKDDRLDGGAMGVRGFLYFDFSFEGTTCLLLSLNSI